MYQLWWCTLWKLETSQFSAAWHLCRLCILVHETAEALEDGTIVPVTEEQLPALQELSEAKEIP